MTETVVQLHEDYTRQEKGRLRRLARREIPERPLRGPDANGSKPFYACLKPEKATEHFDEECTAGTLMVSLCARDLDIDPPSVIAMARISPAQAGDLVRKGLTDEVPIVRMEKSVGGTQNRDHVRLEVTRKPKAVARTAAHEVRHVVQGEMSHEEAERDADEYAERAMNLYWKIIEKAALSGPAESG